MAAVAPPPVAAASPRFRPVPAASGPEGPISRWLLRRTLLAYLVLAAAGTALLASGAPEALRALGAGLVLPGGNHLATGHELHGVLALGGFGVSLAVWLLTGFAVVPPLAWALALAGTALHGDAQVADAAPWAVPAAAAGALAALTGLRQAALVRGRRRAATRNAYLTADVVAPPVRSAAGRPTASELGEEDLGVARYVLDRVLQPVGEFGGFDVIEQVQTSALRYQLNFAGYALALLQRTRTPAFTGYVSEGQRLAIAKMQDRRVWEYWRLENLLGNLDPSPDPIRRDNIMFSAFLGVMVGAYARASGDRRFEAPGSLAFAWDERRTFAYDHGSLADAVAANFARRRLRFFPCEPHWNFAVCNTMGMNALLLADAVQGTSRAAPLLDGWRQTLDEEFTAPDGRLVPIRNGLAGFRIPTLMLTFLDAATAFYAHGAAPEVAERSWAILRHEVVELRDGRVVLHGGPYDGLDDGNYTRSPAGGLAGVALAAREMGDEEVARAALLTLHEALPPARRDGELALPCSTKHNLTAAMARFSAPGAFHDLVTGEGGPPAGPVLAEAPYPDVLVAQAVSDGADLRLVLRPGRAPGRQALRVERLAPGAAYRLRGAVATEGVAGADGALRVEVDLEDRLEVVLAPA